MDGGVVIPELVKKLKGHVGGGRGHNAIANLNETRLGAPSRDGEEET